MLPARAALSTPPLALPVVLLLLLQAAKASVGALFERQRQAQRPCSDEEARQAVQSAVQAIGRCIEG